MRGRLIRKPHRRQSCGFSRHIDRDRSGYGYPFEQIGAYQSLSVIARNANYPQHTSWIDGAISEEQEAARKVEALIKPVTERYLQLTLSDEKGES